MLKLSVVPLVPMTLLGMGSSAAAQEGKVFTSLLSKSVLKAAIKLLMKYFMYPVNALQGKYEAGRRIGAVPVCGGPREWAALCAAHHGKKALRIQKANRLTISSPCPYHRAV